MPNIVTHGYITAEAYPEPTSAVILGSTLPDFVGMHRDYNGVVVHGAVKQAGFAEGMDFHQRTDWAFDGQATRHALMSEFIDDCQELTEISGRLAGVLANIGTDILIDVVVMDDERGAESYERLKESAEAHHADLASVDEVFAEMVRAFFANDRPFSYRDPLWLAERLRDRFATRTAKLLEIPEELVPQVAGVFDRHTARLREQGAALLAATITELKSQEAA